MGDFSINNLQASRVRRHPSGHVDSSYELTMFYIGMYNLCMPILYFK